MIINSLTLKNFKSHKNTKIDFTGNITLILGKNGAGKSSILEAISFCLFKEFNGKKIDNIVRKSKEEEDIVKEMYVTLEFTHDNIDYKIKRGKKGTKNIAELWQNINGEYVLKFKGDKNVTNDIQSIIQLDSKSFLNAVYIKQGDITDLIDKSPAERKELISKLLNIDSFETAWNGIKSLQDIYEDKIKDCNRELSRKESIEEDIQNISGNINKNRQKLDNIQPELTKLETLLKDEDLELTKLENNKINYENKLKQKGMIESNLAIRTKEKEEYCNKLDKIEEYEKEISALEKEVQKLPYLEDLKEKKDKLNENLKNIREYEEKIKDIENNIKIREETRKAHNHIQNLTNEIPELHDKRKELNEQYLEYEKIKIQINEKKENINNIRNELQRASENATSMFNEYFDSPESIERKVSDEKEKVEKYIENLTKQINENDKKIGISKDKIRNTEKSLKELEDTTDICPICQSKITPDKHEELSRKYNEELVRLSLEIENYENSNENQNKTLEDKKEFLNKINSINIDALKDKNNQFKKLNAEIKELEDKISGYSDVKSSLDAVEEKINSKEKEVEELQKEEKRYYYAINRLDELGDPEEYAENINELNEISKKLTDECHEIIIKYAVGDNLALQIKILREKDQKLNVLRGSVQDKESVMNKIEERTNEINGYTNNLKDIEEEMKSIEYDEDVYENKKKTYASNREKYDEKNKKYIELDTEIRKDEENIEKHKEEMEKLKEKEKERKHLQEYYKLLEKLRDVYSKDGVQKDLRENVKPLITKETIDIFNNFDFEYSDMTLDEDYNIILHNKNEELSTDMISGGEKIVVALALRLGIAKVLSKNKTDLLILDEPTIHLDDDRRQRLIGIISQINFVPQMLVVTHDEEMETGTNNIITIKKENGISFVEET